MTVLGYQFGKYGNTRLDWYLAADPRPDYYRKLPSYQETEEGKAAVTAYLTSDEAHRQLDWDGMYLANKLRYETIQNVDGIEGNTVSGRSSAYIVEEQRFDVNKMAVNSILNSQLTDQLSLTSGVQLLREKNHNFKVVDDLMGAIITWILMTLLSEIFLVISQLCKTTSIDPTYWLKKAMFSALIMI